MKAAIDLHIHSALSPCADNDMTPNNIVNMAVLKGLDIIAVTDHNSAGNIEAVLNCARGKGIVVVPGMELETREEVHLVCLFPDSKAVFAMQQKVYSLLPEIKNREEIFGKQLILDEKDNIKGIHENMLVTAADIAIEKAAEMVENLGGVAIPAHVDRESYSILSNLGMIPEHMNFKYIEISRNCNRDILLDRNPVFENYSFIRSSDAHYLWDIFERESFIDLEEFSIECLLKRLKGG